MSALTPMHAELRYAVLRHDGIPDPHFDLLVETFPGSELATWRSPVWPIDQPTPLIRLKDHRRIYLDFEGELTDGRGTVHRVAVGCCVVHIDSNSVSTIQLGDQMITLTRRSATDWHAENRAVKLP